MKNKIRKIKDRLFFIMKLRKEEKKFDYEKELREQELDDLVYDPLNLEEEEFE